MPQSMIGNLERAVFSRLIKRRDQLGMFRDELVRLPGKIRAINFKKRGMILMLGCRQLHL